jgi:excisionase family DNA binding protein
MHAEPQYLTVTEFAVRLRVSERTIVRLIASGLPSSLVGGSRRVLLEPAEVWLGMNTPSRRRRR